MFKIRFFMVEMGYWVERPCSDRAAADANFDRLQANGVKQIQILDGATIVRQVGAA